VPLRNTQRDQPAKFDERSAGVPLSRDVLEGRESTPSFTRMQTSVTSAPRVRWDVMDVSPAAMEARIGARIDGAVGTKDARSLGATRPGRRNGEVYGSAETPAAMAVDARMLGARPEGVGSALMRNVKRGPMEATGEARERLGLEERQRFPPRREGTFRNDQLRSENGMQERQKFTPRREDGFRSDRPRSENDYQERAPRSARDGPREEVGFRSDHSRSENGIQDHISRFPRDGPQVEGGFRSDQPRNENGIQERSPRFTRDGQGHDRPMFNRVPRGDGAPQRNRRPGRPRATRDGDGDGAEPRRRKGKNGRGARGGGGTRGDRDDSSAFNEPIWNEEEEEYFKQKRKAEAPQTLEFNPINVTRDALSGVGPAFSSGEWGLSEVLGERLLLANRSLNGEFVQWDSKEQKADVMTLVERLKTLEEQEKHDKEGNKGKSLVPETEDQTQVLMQKLLGGTYQMVKPQQEKDILGNVARHVGRNESYFPDDQRILLEKVRSILPADAGSNGKSVKQTA